MKHRKLLLPRSKEDLVKSINAALIIAPTLLYSLGTLFLILFIMTGFGENKLIDYIIFGGFFLFFMFIPAIILQVVRRKYWIEKHASILKK
ncbi:hypothetical protein [Metabacillus rhizolycopersici]|uniref:Uncharacterized protein n=1 Tax=Metabacillus rhizolycopersici TaxID=2875709 RepID=A0ABS7UYA9_9BACI|nr:hypothetical protein [Metabacillus rhizolycopersici]MBZ5753305.1 hypothetical protein [Metabacillus rhizolycopersici]